MSPAPLRYEVIARDLAQAIRSGQLAAGEKLPPHRTMATRLGVTTGTVSRAYARLERQGLAMARVGDGTYVRNVDPAADEVAASLPAPPIDLAHNVATPCGDGSALAATLADLSRDGRALQDLLGYQPETGMKAHRVAGARWLRRFGTGGHWERVMVTHGAQHALACVLRTLSRPGDTLLTEALSYPGLLELARSLRLHVVGLDCDAQGLRPDALDKAARTFSARLLFCSPTLHNPTGATMSVARREAIAGVIRQRNLLLLEDVVHAAILQAPPPALSTWVPAQSFLMSSWAKVLSPGLRVGWLEASPEWLDKVAASIRADSWMVAPLMPQIATRWFDEGVADTLIAAQRDCVDQRLALARDMLAGLQTCSQDHHPLVWLALPQPWRTDAMLAALAREGVLVRSSSHFTAGRATPANAIRISLNAVGTLAQLRTGLGALRELLRPARPG